MMDSVISYDQLQSLASMLDPQAAARGPQPDRPASQTCGYSLAEARTTTSHHQHHDDSTSAPSNPGLVKLPPAMAHKLVAVKEGLPVPSMTREGRELAATATEAAAGKARKPAGNDIWATDEIDPSFGAAAGATEAGTAARNQVQRAAPEYEMVFKHQVSTEDRFLGMDFTRDGSAGTADAVVLRISMPKEESVRDISLDVKDEELSLLSPAYALRVSLPMRVQAANAVAQWDKRTHVLSVTLKADASKREVMLM